jgi:hypothetical protein
MIWLDDRISRSLSPQLSPRAVAAALALKADKGWQKMRFSQKMSSFNPNEYTKKMRKLRQIIQHHYMQGVRYGMVELRDALASTSFSKTINEGEDQSGSPPFSVLPEATPNLACASA